MIRKLFRTNSILFLQLVMIGVFSFPSVGKSKDTLSGKFSGSAVQSGCRSSKPWRFSGEIKNGVITIRNRQATMRGRIDSDGGFSVKGNLRQHRRGMKLQWWSGRITGRRVAFSIKMGVPNYQQTFCTASASAKLQ